MVTISIRLRPGKDNDILQWWESLDKGERSGIVRSILRSYINQEDQSQQRVSRLNFGVKKENLEDLGDIEFRMDFPASENEDDNEIDKKVDLLVDQF
ncbi:hypothetical protein BBF96_03335 [Anoxybacter fermentans]|uniref:Uncharacterized protein n=1 Tax=Anoxybacter fermentans TaxID=1323375 RepID=A0A3Q9HQR7_9FIRM|nr:hypothetical protein BBF96_03335 [Anoxybacter fermentans]